ncbi:sensor histidine kinase [Bowmanella denitrificans]|uniref:sensor histidine kinase n=1 Tax=Bowmanella denitrificans TaxID=366582 RepID=UPI000C9B4416|nr:ATP-binding protein [Bowmanella denitrificans]
MHRPLAFELRLVRLCLLAALPVFLLALLVMVQARISIWLILLTALLGSLLIGYCCYQIWQSSLFQFRSLYNLLDAITRGDYSLRARVGHQRGAFAELVLAINALSEQMSRQRLISVESQLLVQTIIEQIDVAILAFTPEGDISFINPAARVLLQVDEGSPDPQLLQQLQPLHNLSDGSHQAVTLPLRQRQGRFNVHIRAFREAGKPHKLLFITDVSHILRQQENKAWQSLVRVISHEINNSLSPIMSISQTLQRLVGQPTTTVAELQTDLQHGLTLIGERAAGLKGFVDGYKQLARLPTPNKQPTSLRELLDNCIALFATQPIRLLNADSPQVQLDPVQMQQVLINLLKNAQEAMQQAEQSGEICIHWTCSADRLHLHICDNGVGISNTDNLFVPYYSTKQGGSGIGLVLSRQIVEAHGGQISLTNRPEGSGCCAIIELPLA